MMTIENKNEPGEIVCQVFNFVDMLGGVGNMNVEVLEKFLMSRGVIAPA